MFDVWCSIFFLLSSLFFSSLLSSSLLWLFPSPCFICPYCQKFRYLRYLRLCLPLSNACSVFQKSDGRIRYPSHPSHPIKLPARVYKACDWLRHFRIQNAYISRARAVIPSDRNILWSKWIQTRILHAVCTTQSNLCMLPLPHARQHLHNSLTDRWTCQFSASLVNRMPCKHGDFSFEKIILVCLGTLPWFA